MAEHDFYAVLGVDDRANADEIKRAFRRLTLEFHPDRHAGDMQVEERYRLINVAYETLSDPSSRSRYDAARRLSQLDLSRGFDPKSARDLLGNVFGDVFGTRRNLRRRGRDLKYTLTVELAQAVLGSTHAIEFEALGPCPTCKGSGTRPGGKPPESCPICAGRGEVKGEGLFARRTRCGRCDGTGMIEACETCRGAGTKRSMRAFEVKLPPGIVAGSERVIAGQGEPGRFGGDPGDLRITVNVRPHPRLARDGDDIRCDVAVSITEAALGTRVSIPTVDGDVEVEIPAGIKSGTKLRLRGKGVPKVDARGRAAGPRGDQLAGVVVETPNVGASARVRSLLTELEIECARAGALPRRASEREKTIIGDGNGPGTGTGTGTGTG